MTVSCCCCCCFPLELQQFALIFAIELDQRQHYHSGYLKSGLYLCP